MSKGKRIALTQARRLVDDVLWLAKRQPMAAFYRDLDLSRLEELRKRTQPRLSWNVIMMKAYALVSRQYPELRQCFVGLPWAHIYQAEETVAVLTVARNDDAGQRLYFARFHTPEKFTLRQLQDLLNHYCTEPPQQIKQFRHQDRFSAAPTWVRRLLWRFLVDLWPAKRCAYLGTFGMSLSGFNQTFGNCHLGPSTTVLGVDPTPRQGISRVLLTFDHRILDGKPAIDVIAALNRELHGPILAELEEMVAVCGKAGNATLERQTT